MDFTIAGDAALVLWLGRRERRAGVIRFFEELRRGVTPQAVIVDRIVVDGESALVIGTLASVANATGKLIESEFAIDMIIRDGAIVRYRVFEDSFAVAEAVRPDR